MSSLSSLQTTLLNLSPGLLPLGVILYSFFNSWHCGAMCGSLAFSKSTKQNHTFLSARLFSYTAMGISMSYVGLWLKDSLEYKVSGVFGLFFFIILTITMILPEITPLPRQFSVKYQLKPLNRSLSKYGPLLKGLLISLFPCPLLALFYGVSALIGNPIIGGALLFAHAVMTTPALGYSRKLFLKLNHFSPKARLLSRFAIIVLTLFNLFYFTGKLLYADDAVLKNKIFFCF